MSARTATRLAWSIWAFQIVLVFAAIALSMSAHRPFAISDVSQVTSFIAVATVGAVVASHEPRNALGWVYLSVGLIMIGLAGAPSDYAYYATVIHPGALGGTLAEWVTNWAWVPAFSLLLTFSLLLFPDGRLPSRRWRPVGWACAVVGALWSVAFMFEVHDYTDALGRHARNPFAIAGFNAFFDGAREVLAIAFFILVTCCIASLVVRFRRGDPDERHQLKWLIFAGILVLVWMSIPFEHGNGTWVDAVTGAVITLIPISAGIAILKYRLYDIDVVISKAVVYGALAAFITVVYIAVVVGIGALVGTRGKANLPLSLVATAIVAVAFQPILARVRHLADRIAYGKRATPYEVLAAFSDRVGEAYAIDDVLDRMAQVLRSGTGADVAAVWLRSGRVMRAVALAPESATPPAEPPQDTVEVRHQGETLGALSVQMPANDRLDPARQKLVQDLAAQAGLALRNVALIEDLTASRQRLVAAQDEERRKIERNIHDGAQQQLVALAIQLKLAEQMIDRDSGKTKALLGQLQGAAGSALEDLRDLARGIYPPLLADQGLSAALEAQARKAALPVTVEADGIGRFSQDVEATVYFCTLEALNNVAKYAGATSASVRVANGDGHLRFEIHDNGAGFDPAETGYGTGLQGMADRLAAQGGTLSVRSAPGSGTTVEGRLPIGVA
jgi:signal transduction histidine kinase